MAIKKFIVCGVSRAGKSILAKRLQERFKISWIIGDAIVSSLQDAFPDLGIAHNDGLRDMGDGFEQYIKYLLWQYDYAGCGYIFDSTHLHPLHLVRMREKIGPVPAVFLGYAEASVEQKLQEIRRFDPKNWWTAGRSDDELKEHINKQIEKSKQLRQQCAALSFPYVEVSHGFEKAIGEAESLLISGKP